MPDSKLRDMLKRHEGFRRKPYRCTGGFLTIGYGRNIEYNGITEEEADMLLDNDIEIAKIHAKRFIPNFDDLSENRRRALIDMAFNLGSHRLFEFRKTRQAILREDFSLAAAEMLDSRWSKQVGVRAIELAGLMREG